MGSERLPQSGELVEVRGQRWVAADVTAPGAGGSTVVELQSVEDGRYGESLTVVWEVEPARRVLPASSLPDVDGGFDPPDRLAAFLDAVRWSAVTSADVRMLQAPFRSGVAVENYQLVPLARAVGAPRVNLLLADDVGLGKTIEAGLVTLELLLRHRAKRVMVISPAGLVLKWQEEMAEKFGLEFTVVDSDCCARVRRTYGSAANPFRVFPLVIASLPWLRGPGGSGCWMRSSRPVNNGMALGRRGRSTSSSWMRRTTSRLPLRNRRTRSTRSRRGSCAASPLTSSTGFSFRPHHTTGIQSRSPHCSSCWTASVLPAGSSRIQPRSAK